MSRPAVDALSKTELENLFINNDDFEAITAHLNRFNPIRVMRMEQMEIRHSAILAWLLDPNENHGLGDAFLRAFLAEALKGEGGAKLDALGVYQADFSDAEVRREWKNIDIFVSITFPALEGQKSQSWAFVIENKVHSSQGKTQLADYMRQAARALGGGAGRSTIQGVFLTLHEEEPNEDARSDYVCVGYDHIYDILSSLLAIRSSQLGPRVKEFMEQYLEVVGEMTGQDVNEEDLKAKAKDLYRAHKKAIDFIVEHGASSDFALAVQSVFDENSSLANVGEHEFRQWELKTDRMMCIPQAWEKEMSLMPEPWRGCDNWGDGYPLTVWFRLDKMQDGVKGKLRMMGEVGPIADFEIRRELVQRIDAIGKSDSKMRIKFSKTASVEGTKYSRFFQGNVLEVSDTGDSEKIADAMRKLMTKFSGEISAIALTLPGFVAPLQEAGE